MSFPRTDGVTMLGAGGTAARFRFQSRGSGGCGRYEQIRTGQRSARLLNPAADTQHTQIDDCKTKALDQTAHGGLCLRIVAGYEQNPPSLSHQGALVEPIHLDGI